MEEAGIEAAVLGGKKSYFTLVERGSRKTLYLAEKNASSRTFYAVGPVHINNAESRNWHLRAFLFLSAELICFAQASTPLQPQPS